MGPEALEPAFEGVRGTFLVSKILELSKVYPPALTYLEGSRAKLEQRIMQGEKLEVADVRLYAHLNDRLGKPKRTLEVLEQPAVQRRVRSTLLGALPPEVAYDAESAPKYFNELKQRLDNAVTVAVEDRRSTIGQGLALFTAMARAGRTDEAASLLGYFESLEAPQPAYDEMLRVCREHQDARLELAVGQSAARARNK